MFDPQPLWEHQCFDKHPNLGLPTPTPTPYFLSCAIVLPGNIFFFSHTFLPVRVETTLEATLDHAEITKRSLEVAENITGF